jgi:hypothetical protein
MTALALPDVAQAIDREHRAAHQAARTALEHALECGRLLIEAKAAVPHGDWLPWLEEHTTVGARQAQNYMRLTRRRAEIEDANAQRDSHLPIRDAIALLADHLAEAKLAEGEAADRSNWGPGEWAGYIHGSLKARRASLLELRRRLLLALASSEPGTSDARRLRRQLDEVEADLAGDRP